MTATLPGWLRYGLSNKGNKPSLATSTSLLKPEESALLNELSNELNRQAEASRELGEEFSLTLDEETLDALERMLWGVAVGDFKFTSEEALRFTQAFLKAGPQ